ncbi:MAG: flagellar basal body rod protein FlgB [Oscillospiraceae bacterium]|nr:flagellar basal body rod protein FlgB [Oscillospiraceae bacterium]
MENFYCFGRMEIDMFEVNLSGVMEKSLDALWLKQNVISNNIANVDTPGYKSQEVKFENLLSEAVSNSGDISNLEVPNAVIIKNEDTSVRVDGNNVDIDTENLELYRTQIQYEYMVQKLSDQYSNIKIAIMEGKG